MFYNVLNSELLTIKCFALASESEEDECKGSSAKYDLCNEPLHKSINDLPPEVCVDIFSYLSPGDLSTASQVYVIIYLIELYFRRKSL